MGLSIGKAQFSDGLILYFDFQNTSDTIFSGLKKCIDETSVLNTQIKTQITSQPLLADMSVNYGNGISWTAWCSNDRSQVILNFSRDQARDFEAVFFYALDENNVAHLNEERSGFGYFTSENVCGFKGETSNVSAEKAEGKLCLQCLNKHLRIPFNTTE